MLSPERKEKIWKHLSETHTMGFDPCDECDLIREVERLEGSNFRLHKNVTHWMEESFKWHQADLENRRKLSITVKTLNEIAGCLTEDLKTFSMEAFLAKDALKQIGAS